MVSLLFGIGFGELVWYQVKIGRYTIKQAKNYAWFFVALNFTLALAVQSVANLEVAVIICHYAVVVINMRSSKHAKR